MEVEIARIKNRMNDTNDGLKDIRGEVRQMKRERAPLVGGPLGTSPPALSSSSNLDDAGRMKRRIAELEKELDTVKRLRAEEHAQYDANMKGVFARLDNIERRMPKPTPNTSSCLSWYK